ncbi:hypothetical protein [Chitinivorax sp. B]|uniref:protein MIGRI n=1 Tax=Chitinivorax sp. B TaxID=2502235 RepID=UPI0010F802A3|nr:hypothetical protein [Chitinivorax sp. B]
MTGRLLRFALLALVLVFIFQWLLRPGQRAKVAEFTRALAMALLVSGGLILVCYVLGVGM